MERIIDTTDAVAVMVAKAYASATALDDLCDADNPGEVKAAIDGWAKKIRRNTLCEVALALDYAINGGDQTDGEYVERGKKDGEEVGTPVGVLCLGMAVGIGTAKEIARLTQSELCLVARYKAKGDSKAEATSAFGDYMLFRDSLRNLYSKPVFEKRDDDAHKKKDGK